MKNIKKQFIVHFLLVCSVLISVNGEVRADEGKETLLSLINDEDFARLQSDRGPEQNGGGSYNFTDENWEHPSGVYALTHFGAPPPIVDPPSFSAFGRPALRVLNPATKLGDGLACQTVATEYAKRHFSWAFSDQVAPQIVVTPPDDKGIWDFKWLVVDSEGLPLKQVLVKVRSLDLKVIGFSASWSKDGWIPHKIKLEIAKKKTLDFLAKDTSVKNVAIISCTFYELSDYPSTLWAVRVKATNTEGRKVTGTVYVDIESGAIVLKSSVERTDRKIAWTLDKEVHSDEVHYVEDRMPTWTKLGLVFLSNRGLSEAPLWAKSQGQAFLTSKDGIVHLTMDHQASPSYIAGTQSSDWISVVRNGWAYALNLRSGVYRVIGDPSRPSNSPVISPEGKLAVSSSTGHSEHEESDLFFDSLSRSEKLGLRKRYILEGYQNIAAFSADAKWLYFASAAPESTSFSVYRINANSALLNPEETNKKELVVSGLKFELRRMTVSPEGEHLVAQTNKGVLVLSTSDGSYKLLDLPIFKDPNVNMAEVRNITDACAGPSEDSLIFSGTTIDHLGHQRSRIYKCKFDGADFSALTPVEDVATPPYIFPTQNVTAYDVAKNWALTEVQ